MMPVKFARKIPEFAWSVVKLIPSIPSLVWGFAKFVWDLVKIAWRSVLQRGLASLLTMFSMALGVMLVVAVLTIHGVVSESFQNNSSLGYSMIVGSKGGKLQLALNTVYYLSTPGEPIPYTYYLEFHKDERRQREMEKSFASHAHDAQVRTSELQALAAVDAVAGPMQGIAGLLAADVLRQADVAEIDVERGGKFGGLVDLAIPLCLGDYYDRFRVVGTVPAMFQELRFGPDRDRKFEFSQGRNFQHFSKEHGYFEAIVGAKVARELGIDVGHKFSPAHGDPEGHSHQQKFTVVGVLAPSGTPNDRVVFVNIEGFYLMEDHSKPLKTESGQLAPLPPEDEHLREPLPVEQREVTAVLVRIREDFAVAAPGLESSINKGSVAQAVLPVREIYNLFAIIVAPLQWVLLGLTAMICVVSGISILVSIYNSMSDRRQEIAIMRALGAGRTTVMSIVLAESIMLALGGGFAGAIMGHLMIALFSGRIEEETGVLVGMFSFVPLELVLIPGLMLLAVAVGLLPALTAYRTDVAKSLGK